MINLLPPEVKQEYRYAGKNSKLLHWVSVFGLSLVGLILVVFAGLLYLDKQTDNFTDQSQLTRQALERQNQEAVEKETLEIANNLKLAVQVLSKEVLFSKLLQQLGVATPSNVSLSGLSISTLEGAIDITAVAADFTAATQLQVNLADPNNKIFAKADIIDINCRGSGKYPCQTKIRALFAPDSPFLFINSKAGS